MSQITKELDKLMMIKTHNRKAFFPSLKWRTDNLLAWSWHFESLLILSSVAWHWVGRLCHLQYRWNLAKKYVERVYVIFAFRNRVRWMTAIKDLFENRPYRLSNVFLLFCFFFSFVRSLKRPRKCVWWSIFRTWAIAI